MPGLTRSRNPVLEAPPTAPPNGRSLPVRWAVAAALSAAIAGVVWILVARPPAQGLYRIIYWLHDHTGLPVYAHLWRTTQPFSLAWLLPAGVLAGLGLIGWLTNRSLLRAIQRRVLIRAVHWRVIRPPLLASLCWLQARRGRELFATRVLDHLAEQKAQALRSAVARRTGVARHDIAATLALAVEVARLRHRLSGHPSCDARKRSDTLVLLGRAVLCVHASHLMAPTERRNVRLAVEVERVVDVMTEGLFTWAYAVEPVQAVQATLLHPLRSGDEHRRTESEQQVETLARDVRRELRQWSRGVEASLRGYRSQQPAEEPDRPDALVLASALLAASAHSQGRHSELQALSDDVLRLEAGWRAGVLARGAGSARADSVSDLGQAFRSIEPDLLFLSAAGVADVQPVDGQQLSNSIPAILQASDAFKATPPEGIHLAGVNPVR